MYHYLTLPKYLSKCILQSSARILICVEGPPRDMMVGLHKHCTRRRDLSLTQPGIFLSFTVLGVAGALIVFVQLERRAKHPIRTFQRTVWIVLLVSLIPDLLVAYFHPYPGTTLMEVGTLMLMHVATAMICLGILPGILRGANRDAEHLWGRLD